MPSLTGLSSSSDRYDFSNPFMRAVIQTKEGERFPLWIGSTPQLKAETRQGTAVDIQGTKALAFLTEVSVEVQLALIPKITLTLTPPYRDAINFLDSQLMNWGSNTIEVQFGYVSNSTGNAVLSTVYSGVMMKPEVTLGSDITITLTAQGVSSMSASVQEGTRTFSNKSRREMITIIAEGRVAKPKELKSTTFGPKLTSSSIDAKLPPLPPPPLSIYRGAGNQALLAGVDARIVATIEGGGSLLSLSGIQGDEFFDKVTRKVDIDDSEVDDDTHAKLDEIRAPYVQGGSTDWQSIRELLEEVNCFFVWEGSKLKILPRGFTYSKEASRIFRVFDYPKARFGPADSVFPILSASSPTSAVFLHGASRSVHLRGQDPDTRKVKVTNVDDSTESLGRTQDGGTTMANSETFPPTDEETGDGGKTMPGNPSDPNALALAKAEYAKASKSMGINLNIESLADPNLYPGQTIKVQGLGRRFDGTYVVFKSTFTFGGAGSTMNLECVANASAVADTVANRGKAAKDKKAEISDDSPEIKAVLQD